jgi:ArsR family transcriptional regulator
MANYKNKIKSILSIFDALSDINRLRILMSLKGGPLCVCRIIALLGLAPSTVSKHLYILRQAELVDAEKKGRWMYYQLSGGIDKKFLKWLQSALAGDEKIGSDAKVMKSIIKEDPEILCRQLKRK